ncbi:condensation domain-containing protein [Plantactinospora sp. B6F1]|uniref:condensation domain-containing protein n=1 Tax=Plantactinospora sp. B6F1 TaxID=3158971 RepID=UPI0032D8BA90
MLVGSADSFRLSPAQETLWEYLKYFHPGDPGAAAMNLVGTAMLPGTVDIASLRAAVDEVGERHEPLHTRFARAGMEPRLTLGCPRVPLIVSTAGDHLRADHAERLAAVVDAAVRRRFDLLAGPLWAAYLVRRQRDSVLVVSLFPIVGDERSIWVLIRELGRSYRARAGLGPAPAAVPTTYRATVTSRASTPALDDDVLRQWCQRLLPLPEALPQADPPVAEPPSLVRRRFSLPPPTRVGLTRTARLIGTTRFVLLLGAYAALLALRAGTDRVVMGTPTPGRHGGALGSLVGRFADILYVEIRVSTSMSFHDLSCHVQERLTEAARVAPPFTRLAALVHPAFLDDRPWPFVHLIDAWFSAETVAGSNTSSWQPPRHVRRHAPGARVNGSGGVLAYDPRHFTSAQVDTLADGYVRLVCGVVADPHRPIGGHRAQ